MNTAMIFDYLNKEPKAKALESKQGFIFACTISIRRSQMTAVTI